MSAAGILKRIKINTRTDSEMSAEATTKAVLSVRGGVRGRTESAGFPTDDDYCSPARNRIILRHRFGKTVNNYILIYSGIIHTRLMAACTHDETTSSKLG